MFKDTKQSEGPGCGFGLGHLSFVHSAPMCNGVCERLTHPGGAVGAGAWGHGGEEGWPASCPPQDVGQVVPRSCKMIQVLRGRSRVFEVV